MSSTVTKNFKIMNVEIISVWESQYKGLKRNNVLSPLTPTYLAALFPSDCNVAIRNEQVNPIDYDIDVDLVAITFMISNAIHAYEVGDRFRERGVAVIMGGFHASAIPEEALEHADAVIVGEAENVLPGLLDDFKKGTLKRTYKSEKLHSLKGLPLPRYELAEKDFILKHTVQATRGCPYTCSFCSVISSNPGLRVRPVDDVIRDITHFEGHNYFQNKMLAFVDNNLTGNPKFAKELFIKMRPLKKWWWSQVTIDMAYDRELVRLAAESGCVSVFVGLETFNQKSLNNVGKYQNKFSDYKKAIKTLHDCGIYVMGSLVIGLEEDTVGSISKMTDIIQELDVDLPYLHILTPFYGTELFDQLNKEGRILTRDWSLYNMQNVVSRPGKMSVDELHSSYLDFWKVAHSVPDTLIRVLKNWPTMRLPSLIWRFLDNGYFMSQNLLGNYPLVGVEGGEVTKVTKV